MDFSKFVILLGCICSAFSACPDNCQCENSSLGSTVHCTPTSQDQLKAQITGLPEDTVELHIGDYGNLNCNLEKKLLDNTFQAAPKTLANLYIDQCRIESIGTQAFVGLTNLQDLFIIGNPIQQLPDSLLKGLDSLQGFLIQDCPLTSLKATVFDGAPCFRRLEISGTKLVDLTDAFSSLTNCITNLNISRNQLSDVKKKMLAPMTRLLQLDVSYNLGVTFEKMAFNDLSQLNYLSVAGVSTDGNTLPEDLLSGLFGLIEVNVADNGFKAMNKIEQFLKDVLQVKYLDASGNELTALNNEELVQLQYLETLDLGNNRIMTIEADALRVLAKLSKLNLDHNSIDSLPNDLFIYSGKVKDLDLSYNGMNSITTNTFTHLTQLNRLNLAGSNLATLNMAMFPSNLKTVTTLDLSNSSITTVNEDAFESLVQLASLNLDNNEISHLPKGLLEKWSKTGVEVDISRNDWNCNCEMFLYRQWMEASQLNYSMICAAPPQLKGQDAMTLPDKEAFGCLEPSVKECCDVNLTRTEGESAVFTCTVEAGDPAPTLAISVVSGDPLPWNKTQISSDKSKIVITDLMVDDTGEFTCTASNVWGNATTTYRLTVEAVLTTTTLEPNTTTYEPNTTTYEPNTTTAGDVTTPLWTTTDFSTLTPTTAPSHNNGAVIGIVIVLVLIAIAVAAALIAWYVKKRRNADDRSSLVTNQSV